MAFPQDEARSSRSIMHCNGRVQGCNSPIGGEEFIEASQPASFLELQDGIIPLWFSSPEG